MSEENFAPKLIKDKNKIHYMRMNNRRTRMKKLAKLNAGNA
jgi:hypothetical protein